MVTEATVEGEVGAAREEEEPESEQLSSGHVVVGQRPWAALVPRHTVGGRVRLGTSGGHISSGVYMEAEPLHRQAKGSSSHREQRTCPDKEEWRGA
jgi:hypothetical protein